MDLYIFDKNLEFKGILDVFKSLRWVRRYSTAGEFELHCVLSPIALELLQRESIVYKKGDLEAGFIESRHLGLNSNGEEMLQIKGKLLTGYLDRRVNFGISIANTAGETAMRTLVDSNCINTTAERIIPYLSLDAVKGLADVLNNEVGRKSLLTELENISNFTELGYRIKFDYVNKQMLFEVYKGMDRTAGQSINPPAIFSRDFENILEQQYVDSTNNYKNVAVILGARNKQSMRVKDGINKSGIDRFELFVDSSSVSDIEEKEIEVPDFDPEGNIVGTHMETIQVEIPWTRYEPMLFPKGDEELSKCRDLKTFDSKVNMRSNLVYKQDFDLGDLVTYIDKKWGVRVDTRITEVEEVYEENGVQINPIFGNNIPTLIDKIKQKLR